MSDHSGTHIDQLNYVGIRQPNGEYLIYNGIRNRDVIDTFGTKKLGIETMPPLITRGILVDVAGFKGVEFLDAGYAIQPAEIDSALAAQRTQVKEAGIDDEVADEPLVSREISENPVDCLL